jgi:hypothetical protein
MGRHGAWSSALQDLAARRIGVDGVCVVLPRPRQSVSAYVTGDVVAVDGLVLGPRDGHELVVLVDEPVNDGLSVPSKRLTFLDQVGLDRRLGVTKVVGQLSRSELGTGVPGVEDGWWTETIAELRLALASYIAGGLRRMFTLARDHAVERQQFGRQIGTFQAVRHKLAECFVAVESLDGACAAAWESEDRPLAAATTKLVASQCTATVAAHTQQVLAGIGFTAEHEFHRTLKPVLMADRMLGSTNDLSLDVGRALVACGAAPRLCDL